MLKLLVVLFSSIERITNNRSYPSDEMIKQCGILFSIGYEGYKKLSKSDKEKISEGIGTVGGGVLGFGSITAVVSSLGYAGLSAAGITSGLAAAGGLVGGGMALGITAIAAIPVAAGTLSGGISASVSGGNFWQGARQGAITSGLNHIANHTKNLIADKKFKNDLIAELKENGIITDATPEFNKSSIIELLSKSTTLGNLWEKSGYIGFKLSSIEKGLNGEVDETATKSSLTGKYTSITANKVILYKTAFQSFGKLAYVIGHELIHVYHIKIGFTLNILNSMEPIPAKKYLEINAYKWNLAYGDPEAQAKINYYQK